ncbi:hypothetical protein ACSQ67_024022 [Phaseolus vulgaris]
MEALISNLSFIDSKQESVDDAERNHFLVNYVDCAFDDFGGSQPPVYPGLSTVWGSLARSKKKPTDLPVAPTTPAAATSSHSAPTLSGI